MSGGSLRLGERCLERGLSDFPFPGAQSSLPTGDLFLRSQGIHSSMMT